MKNKLLHTPIIVLMIASALIIGCEKTIDEASTTKEENKVADLNSVFGSSEYCGISSSGTTSSKNHFGTKSVVIHTNTIFNTDFLSAGVGGMRGIGTGQITLPATFTAATVTTAYLYWHGVTNSSTDVGSSITVNSTTVNGTNIGVSSSNCWPFTNSQAYRADVTSLVQSTGPGNYDLSGFGDLNPNGASLIVFFNDGNNTNNRDVVIFDGNDSNIQFAGIPGNPNAPADPQGWDVLLSGINYVSGSANIQLHVGDGQPFLDAALLVNTTQIDPAGPIFQGASVPGGQLWDIKSYDVTSFLSPGPNSLNLTTGLNNDCLGLIVALIDLPAGAAPPVESMTVPFDYRPRCCPNPFSCATKGTETAAILGTAEFDVSKIDLSTVKLNGISPVSSLIKDVAKPFTGQVTDCSSCTIEGPDGKNDLTLKFDIQSLVPTLGTITDKQCVKITITGKLLPEFGGTTITGHDMILISK